MVIISDENNWEPRWLLSDRRTAAGLLDFATKNKGVPAKLKLEHMGYTYAKKVFLVNF